MFLTRTGLAAVLLLVAASGTLAQLPPDRPSADDLIQKIDEGANASLLKYGFLMRRPRRGVDRAAALAQVERAVAAEADADRKLILESVLAFGLTRSGDSRQSRRGWALYLELLQEREWPDRLQDWRNKAYEDFFTIGRVNASDIRKGRPLFDDAFEAYLRGEGTISDGAVFVAAVRGSAFYRTWAREMIDRVRKETPEGIDVLTRIGEFYLGQRLDDSAYAVLGKAWEVGPEDDAARKRIGRAIVNSRRREHLNQAIAWQEKVIASLDVKDDYVTLADLHRAAKHWDAMRSALDQQLECAPGDRSRVEVSEVLIRAERYEEAAEVLVAIPADPSTAEGHADEGALWAALVQRLRVGVHVYNEEQVATWVDPLKEACPELLELARRDEWVANYYRKGVAQLRAIQAQRERTEAQER